MKKFLSIFIPVIGGTIVGFITSNFINYNELVKPVLSPPSIVFPIVWTVLYLLIGFSYFLVKKDDEDFDFVSIVYYVQLFVNFLWSFFFFVFKFYLFSAIWLVLLILIVLFMTWLFYQKNKLAAYLLIPYILWLSFALYLNIGIVVLN